MKWFMAANQESLQNDGFLRLLRLALHTAQQNTSLEPYLIYDGEECAELEALKGQGITALRTSLTIEPELRAWMTENYPGDIHLITRRGAFLRMELGKVIQENGLKDEYVLYTDCDVMFMQEPDVANCRPDCLAATGKKEGGRTWLRLGGCWHFSSGVLVLNTASMINCSEGFRNFVLNNGEGVTRPPMPFFQKNLFLSDQVSINLFFRNRIQRLPQKLNWNPRNGVSSAAEIVHFNGLKWTEWEDFQNKRLSEHRQAKFSRQIGRGVASYEHYCQLALQLESGI